MKITTAYFPPLRAQAPTATMVAPPDSPRAAAEAKVEGILATCATEAERALLFHVFASGLDWTRDRAKQVLQKAGWWL